MRSKWLALKNRYAKELEKEDVLSLLGNPFVSKWPLFEKLDFLRTSVEAGKSEGNFSSIVNKHTEKEQDKLKEDPIDVESFQNKEELVDAEETIFNNSFDLQSKMGDKPLVKKDETPPRADLTTDSTAKGKGTQAELHFTPSSDPVMQFLLCLHSTIVIMPEDKRFLLMTNIMELVQAFKEKQKQGKKILTFLLLHAYCCS